MTDRKLPANTSWNDWESFLRSEQCPQPPEGPLPWEDERQVYHADQGDCDLVRIYETRNTDAMVQSDLYLTLTDQ